MKKIVLTLILLLIPLNAKAASESFIIKCDKTSFKEFAEFACRVSANAAFIYDKVEFELSTPEGLSLDEVRSNYDFLWQVEIKDKIVTATTKRGQYVSDLQEFGILLFQTMDSGTQTIEIKKIVLSNSENSKTLEIADVKQDIEVLSSENKLRSLSINTIVIKGFDPQISSYLVEIEKEQTSIDIAATPMNTTAVIEGLGTIDLDITQNEFIIPIYVRSASGTRKVYLLNLIRAGSTPNNEITASEITLTDNNKKIIDFKFNPNNYEYNIEVASNIKSVDINVSLENSEHSLVKGFGNRTIEIEEGDNSVLIKIKDQNGYIKTYVLNIVRVLSNKSANCYLKTLAVEDYIIKFNKKVKQYTLAINKNQDQLNITAIPDHKSSVVTIIGNDNLKENSVIKVMVTAENGSKITYQITITYKKTNNNMFLISLAIILLGAISFHEIRKKRIAKAKAVALLAEETRRIELAQIEEARKAEEAVKKAEAKRLAEAKRKAEEDRLAEELAKTATITIKKPTSSKATSKKKGNQKPKPTPSSKAPVNKPQPKNNNPGKKSVNNSNGVKKNPNQTANSKQPSKSVPKKTGSTAKKSSIQKQANKPVAKKPAKPQTKKKN